MSYGAEEQFENEALMAVRTANFISAFLQVVDPKEIFPGTSLSTPAVKGSVCALTSDNLP